MPTDFVTCINCIDGRIQLPVIQWILSNYEVKYVDMITEPGINGLLADKDAEVGEVVKKVGVSVEGHSTNHIFIVGHHDCLANPVDDETHKNQIKESVSRIEELFPFCEVIGLWVDSESKVHKI